MDLEIEKISLSTWMSLSEEILIKIFHYLPASSLLTVAQVCKTYYRVAFDESLWKDLFYRHWKINRTRPMCPRKVSWVQEYKRLYYHTPTVESEIVRSHTDEVLHVSFAQNGKMFATCSKDGFIKVWDKNRYPCSLKNEANMKRLNWECTAFSQFNESDTLLLVSGLLSAIGPFHGEIVIFSLQGDFTMLNQVICTPYDVQGTWYKDYFLSGSLIQFLGGASCSEICLIKATQKMGEHSIKRILRFRNKNYSHVRILIIANVVKDNASTTDKAFRNTQILESHPNQPEDNQSKWSVSMHEERNQSMKDTRESSDNVSQNCKRISDQKEEQKCHSSSVNVDESLSLKSVTSELKEQFASARVSDEVALQTRQFVSSNNALSLTTDSNDQKFRNEFSARLSANNNVSIESSTSSNMSDKYLIFTFGTETYAATHIGIKRFREQDYIDATTGQLVPDVPGRFHSSVDGAFDNIEYIFDMHGQIIGMCLSPDHRYLYVNSRRWLEGYQADYPIKPPPVSEEISLHVFDLMQFKIVDKMDTSHKAYTTSDNCFFLYLDVCEDYVASGAEDKHGHIWDRHYGICLNKVPHLAVVNAVAFNPTDPEMLVTVSDDFAIKIWRSRNRVNNLVKSKVQDKEGVKLEFW